MCSLLFHFMTINSNDNKQFLLLNCVVKESRGEWVVPIPSLRASINLINLGEISLDLPRLPLVDSLFIRVY